MFDIGRKKTLEDEIREMEQALINFQLHPFTVDIYKSKTGKTPDDLRRELELKKKKNFKRFTELTGTSRKNLSTTTS